MSATPQAEEQWEALDGKRIDQFRILRLIGKGGMGRVYLARDAVLGRKVAIKFIQNRVDTKHFVEEARATAKFNHAHIVTLHAVGIYRGAPYLVLEYLKGQTLRARLKTHPPLLGEAIQIAATIASALAEAHRHGIAHLDLKPANMIIPLDGRLRVLDFGLAERTRDAGDPKRSTVRGTPAYMAPEQWTGEDVGTAADVWALGVILYEMLTGKRPFKSFEAELSKLEQTVTGDAPVPALSMPDEISSLVMKCLNRVASERPTAAKLEASLNQLLKPESASSPKEGPKRTTCPYPGLLAFSETQAELFFGREAEITELMERLRQQPVVPVVGTSGVGKSSLVQAGLIPRLSQLGGWCVLQIRPGPRPFESLEVGLESLERPLPSSHDTMDATPLTSFVEHPERLCFALEERARAEQVRYLIFVDQMEEIFTLGEDPEVAEAFLRAIASAADDPQGAVRVIFTIRADYFARAAELHPTVSEVLQRALFLKAPSRAALAEILTEPLKPTGYRFDDGLVDKMVDDAGKQSASLPLLQFTARQLWENRDEANLCLTQAAYDGLGGVAGALIQHGDQVLDALGSEDIQVARDLLLRMVTSEHTRRVTGVDDALEGLGPRAQSVLDALISARLVTTVRLQAPHGVRPAVELAHESLIKNWRRLRSWVDAQHDELRFLMEAKEAADFWVRRGRPSEEVWTRRALTDAEDMLEKCSLPVPGLVTEFIAAGRALERQRAFRRRGITATVVVVSLFMAAFTTRLALNAREEAARARDATRVAAARAAADDPTTRLSLLREVENPPPGWEKETLTALTEGVSRHRIEELGVMDVELSHDGRHLLLSYFDGRASLWRTSDFGLIRRIRLPESSMIRSAVFSPDDAHIVFGVESGAIFSMPVEAETEPQKIGAHKGLTTVVFSPTDRRVLSAGRDGRTLAWTLDAPDAPKDLLSVKGAIGPVQTSADGRWIAVGTSRGQLRVWDSLQSMAAFDLQTEGPTVDSIAFHPKNHQLLAGDGVGGVQLWDLTTKTVVRKFLGHSKNVRKLGFLNKGTRVWAAGDDTVVRVWHVDTQAEVILQRGASSILDMDAHGPSALIVEAGGPSVGIWNLDTVERWWGQTDHTDRVFDIDAPTDGRWMATVSKDETVRLWRPNAPSEVLARSDDWMVTVAFSSQGNFLYAGDAKGRLWGWSVSEEGAATPIRSQGVATSTDTASEVDNAPITALAIDPSGRRVAIGTLSGALWLKDLDAEAEIVKLAQHENRLRGAAYSPDGQWLAAASDDGVIALYPKSGETPLRLQGAKLGVRTVAFDPSGRYLAAGGMDAKIQIWTVNDPSNPQILSGHEGGISDVTFGPRGRYLASAAGDGTVRIWKWQTSATSIIVGVHTGIARATAFGPNAEWLTSVGHDGVVRRWMNFDPLTPHDPRLWTATTWCLPVRSRAHRLGIPPELAQQELTQCQENVMRITHSSGKQR